MLRLTDEEYERAIEVAAQASAAAAWEMARSRSFERTPDQTWEWAKENEPAWCDEVLGIARSTAAVVINALGADYDVSPMDMGERNDVAEGNVWPEEIVDCRICGERHSEGMAHMDTYPGPHNDDLAQRAIDAALAVAPKPGKVTARGKIL